MVVCVWYRLLLFSADAVHTPYIIIIIISVLLASERSERDTYRGKNEKIGDVYLYICMDVRKAFLYFAPRVFVLVRLSTPSQIALNRILWFIDQYPYHHRN